MRCGPLTLGTMRSTRRLEALALLAPLRSLRQTLQTQPRSTMQKDRHTQTILPIVATARRFGGCDTARRPSLLCAEAVHERPLITTFNIIRQSDDLARSLGAIPTSH